MFDLGKALADNVEELAGSLARLTALRAAVACSNDLPFAQWVQLYAATRSYEPDLVVELGRGYGNSTCVFAEAVARAGNGRVVSVSFDGERAWATKTAPRLMSEVDRSWFDRLTILEQDILDLDLDEALAGAERVLVWWDAHGGELARFLLAEAMPRLQSREHLVCVHDVSDGRYDIESNAYVRPDGLAVIWQGPLVCPYDEIVPIFDFVSRNRIPYATVSESLKSFAEEHPERWSEMQLRLPADVLSLGGWIWYSLADAEAPELAFPEFRRAAEGHGEPTSRGGRRGSAELGDERGAEAPTERDEAS